MSHYCYTCMEEIPEGNYCPHCQKENTPDNIVYRLKPGTILNNKYVVGNCLGEGGFGITYIGRDLMLDIKIAIKEYYPNGYVNRNNTLNQEVTATTESQKNIFSKGKERFLDEARKVAKFLGEPGVVGVRDYFELNGTAYIIMEYLDGMNLSACIKRNGVFDATEIFRLMLPVTRSLKRVHDSGLIHRDIAPDNIMYMKNGTLKLMDFGAARYYTNENKEMSVLLKQGYAPEEQYRKNGKQGPWTDVYAMCATIYRCITGSIPEDALDRLRSDGLVPPSQMGFQIPEALENILLYGMAVFRENRCQSMDELGQLIERALANPVEAARETAHLRPAQDGAKPADDGRTMIADDAYLEKASARPLTGNSVTSNSANPPVKSAQKEKSARHLKDNGMASAAQSGGSVVVQTAPPKKKKKGLVIGLIVGGVAVVVAVALILVFVLGGSAKSMDGTYHWTDYTTSDGQSLASSLQEMNIDMVVINNQGSFNVNDNVMTITFQTDSQTATVTMNDESSTANYRMDGNMLYVEDTEATMIFEKR